MIWLQQNHFYGTCSVYIVVLQSSTTMLLPVWSKSTPMTHSWCQVPLLLYPHIVAAEFLSHRDTETIMQPNGKMEKRHFIPSLFLGKKGTAKNTQCVIIVFLLKTLCLCSEVTGLGLGAGQALHREGPGTQTGASKRYFSVAVALCPLFPGPRGVCAACQIVTLSPHIARRVQYVF